MILAAEGKLLIEFSIVQGKLGKQSHHSTTWISLHLNIESKQSIFNNRFQNANSCVFSEEVMKRSILIWRSKARKQPSDMRQHSHFSRKKEVFLVKEQPFIFTVYNLLQAHPPFPCQRYDFPSSCNVSGKLQPHQKRFMDVWEQQIKQNEQKKKRGPHHFQRLFLLSDW